MSQAESIVIVGGGIIGLAIAVRLQEKGANVTVLSRDFKEAAAHAAAGMIAPQAEQLPVGPFLELCLRSRSLYPNWIARLEGLTGLTADYWDCGILAPRYSPDPHIHPPTDHPQCPAHWLEARALQYQQPGLGQDIQGGWWFPQDGQVDNRLLSQLLWIAAQGLGVKIIEGVTVNAIHHEQGKVTKLFTSRGEWQADHYIVATGAWSQDLLPIPVTPRKGQMVAVQNPRGQRQPLQHVLFAEDTYLVPRKDGRIIIGATSEDVGFTPHNTPAGLQALLARAIRVYPGLQDWPITECWWGFRPTTPDELPILGPSRWPNLTLAVGHYRNGILLAPVTAKVIGDWVLKQKVHALLPHFHYSRFLPESTHP